MDARERREIVANALVYFICDVSRVSEPPQTCARLAEIGIRLVQLRVKGVGDSAAYALAVQVATELRRRGALLIVNDRVDLALAVDADGVHVGAEDLPVSVARRVIGPERILGASAHNATEATNAVQSGADYVGCGSVFPTNTKPDATVRGLDLVREVRAATVVPLYGIGGIDAGNAVRVIQAGANGVAVARAISDAPDPAAAAKQLLDVVRRIRNLRDATSEFDTGSGQKGRIRKG
ncbi:MAG: thiamine-phosphate diphosphorylase [Chloroflexi bacterium 13_1_40CM_4_68_4]|nr:MAG: thiamine-phosphate diphosphorylase [Chloroflexi bacterium 13_1_40CM_4_68_4]